MEIPGPVSQWHSSVDQVKILKESNPVQVAEYVTAQGIGEEPTFAWWVPYVLQKQDVIVAAMNSRVRKTSHKYGIEVPPSVRHAININL
jgi:hypothetical protein